jgi:hypothetical protein
MNQNAISLKIVVILLFIFCAHSGMAQYQVYESVVKQGDGLYEKGVANIGSKNYTTAVANFNEAIKLYEGAKKLSSKPSTADADMDRKIRDCRVKIQEAKPLTPVELTVTPQEVSFGADGGEQTVTVKSNVTWTLIGKTNGDWYEAVRKDNVVTVTSKANTNVSPREFTLDVKAGTKTETVTVKQSGAAIVLTPSVRELTFGAAETGSKSITLSTNAPSWELQANNVPAWVTITKDGQNIQVNCNAANTAQEPRSYTFSVKAESVAVDIKVEQSAAAPFVTQQTQVMQTGTVRTPDRGQTTNVPKEPKTSYSNNDKPKFIGISAGYVQKSFKSDDAGAPDLGSLAGAQVGLRLDPYFLKNQLSVGISTGIFFQYFDSSKDMDYGSSNFEYGYGTGYSHLTEQEIYVPVHIAVNYAAGENFMIKGFAGAGIDYGISSKLTTQTGVKIENLYDDSSWLQLNQFNPTAEFGVGLQFSAFELNVIGSMGLTSSEKLAKSGGVQVGLVWFFK